MLVALALSLVSCVDADDGEAAAPPIEEPATEPVVLPNCDVAPLVEVGTAAWEQHPVEALDDGDQLGFDVGPIPIWRTFLGLHAEGVPEAVGVAFRMVRISDNFVLVDWGDSPLEIALPAWEPGACAGDAFALEITLPGYGIHKLCDLHDQPIQVEVQLFDDDRLVAADVVTVYAWMDPEECPDMEGRPR